MPLFSILREDHLGTVKKKTVRKHKRLYKTKQSFVNLKQIIFRAKHLSNKEF